MKKLFIAIYALIFIAIAVMVWVYFMTRANTAVYTSGSVVSSTTPATLSPAFLATTTVAATATSSVATPTKPPAPVQPAITANAYIVANADTGEVYISYNPTWVSPIASISKLFTALVTYADMNPEQVIAITQPMLDVYSNSYGFGLGEQLTLGDVIPSMLIESNNNLAEGLAMTYGYDAFIAKMNSLADFLELTKTHFEDASGLSNGNVSDARDLTAFAHYLYTTQKGLLSITATHSFFIASTSEHASHEVTSTDPFVGDPHLVGGKTGRTDAAGETMMTIFNYTVGSTTYPISIVVLHSALGMRQIDSEKLLFQAIAVIDKQNAANGGNN